MSLRIVVTNDDGIDSPGLRLLALELDREYDVVVAAPSDDMSGSGTGIGHFDPKTGVDLVEIDIGGLTAFSIDGPPGLAVMAAALGAFGDLPDLVLSGVNAGINTGHSVIHSGTVGAALTARTFRTRGLAVSLDESDPWHWDTAVEVGVAAARWLLKRSGEPRVLNVNVPGLAVEEINGIHWADLDEFGYFRLSNAALETRKLQFEVGPSSAGVDPACDTALCAKGYVTVTPLTSVEPAPFPSDDVASIWCPPMEPGGFAPDVSG